MLLINKNFLNNNEILVVMNGSKIFFLIVGLVFLLGNKWIASLLENKMKYGLLRQQYVNYSEEDKKKLRKVLTIISVIIGALFVLIGLFLRV